MNISCEVIKDLLPLFHDGVCSSDSNKLVEEHLASCEICRSELKAIEAMLPANNTERNLKEAEAVQKLSNRWKRGMWRSLLKGFFLSLIAVAIMFLILSIFMDFTYM